MIESPLAIAAVLAGMAAVSLWLDDRFRWGARIGASLLVIILGALASNTGLLPSSSPVYDLVSGPVTSLAIVWLLLAVDLQDLRAAGPRMLAAFGLGMAATVAGALLGAALFRGAFPGEIWRLAGVLTGTYSGGSLNFVAVGRAVELPANLFTAATAADNVMTAVWMGVTLVLPTWLGGFLGRGESAVGVRRGATSGGDFFGPVSLGALELARLLAIGAGVLLGTELLSLWTPGVPQVIWLTTLALVAAQVPGLRRPPGAIQLGLVALTLFFAVIGVASRVAEILAVGLEIFYLTALVVLVHGLVLVLGARLAGIDAETTAVASQAAVGGPSTAMALAASRGRPDLALSGVMAGLLGYAVGNYAGLAVAALVRGWLGSG